MYKKAARLAEFFLDDFSLGLDLTSAPSQVTARWLLQALNINLTTYKSPEKRGGVTKLYSTAYSNNEVESLFEYPSPSGTNYLLVACGTAIGYYNGSAWVNLKTGLTDASKYYFAVHNGYCFVANGTDDMFKIKNATVYNSVGLTPPSVTPTVAKAAGSITGTYKWVYTYKRSSDEFESNPSPASATESMSSQKATVTVGKTTNTEIDKVCLYRTFDMLDPDNDSNVYFLVTEAAHTPGAGTMDIEDDKTDNDLTTQCQIDNTVPPKAKFVLQHKDRMIYANCPGETDGKSLFMVSKVGKPEACPSSNYHYFDRSDGNEITGIASLPDYLIVFKKNKIAVMEGDFEQWYVISNGIGCIAPYAIITMTDKVVFISEEGIKATDGKIVYDISKKLQPLTNAMYFNTTAAQAYTAAYYPQKKQFQMVLYSQTLNTLILAGHWLASLYLEVPIEDAQQEQYVGWTMHEYKSHTFHCIGSYTDGNGITRLVAGTTNGYVYQLDSGYDDEGNNVRMIIETGWTPLGVPKGLDKTMRAINVVYGSNYPGTAKLYIDVDFRNVDDYSLLDGGGGTFCGYAYCGSAYCGLTGNVTENFDLVDTCGKLFKFRIEDDSQYSFVLASLQPFYRVEGIR